MGNGFYRTMLVAGAVYALCLVGDMEDGTIKQVNNAARSSFDPHECYVVITDRTAKEIVLYTITLDDKMQPKDAVVTTNSPSALLDRLGVEELVKDM